MFCCCCLYLSHRFYSSRRCCCCDYMIVKKPKMKKRQYTRYIILMSHMCSWYPVPFIFFINFHLQTFSWFPCKKKLYTAKAKWVKFQKNIYIHLVWYTCFLLFIILFVIFTLFKATAQTCSDIIWSFSQPKKCHKSVAYLICKCFWRLWWQFELKIVLFRMRCMDESDFTDLLKNT